MPVPSSRYTTNKLYFYGMETFPQYWLSLRRIHQLPVNSHHKGQLIWGFEDSLAVNLNKMVTKQSSYWLYWKLWNPCYIKLVIMYFIDTNSILTENIYIMRFHILMLTSVQQFRLYLSYIHGRRSAMWWFCIIMPGQKVIGALCWPPSIKPLAH